MFESSSDSPDNTVSTMTTNDSVTDEHLLAEIRGDQLQEDNVALIKQLNVLRAQFEQAVQLSAKSKDLYKQIEELKNQLIEEKTKKEDFANRLEISIRAQNEATKQLQDEQQRNSLQRQSDYNTMQKELSKVKKSYQQQIEKLYAENQKLQNQKDQDEIMQKTLVGKIEKAVIHSQHYFNRQISSFDELCDILENEYPPEPKKSSTFSENTKIDFTQAAHTQQIQFLENKIKTVKAKLRIANQKTKEICEILNQKDKQIDSLTYHHQKEMSNLQAKISQISEENDLASAEKNHSIQVLESRLQMLKDENNKTRDELNKQRDENLQLKTENAKLKEEKNNLKVKAESIQVIKQAPPVVKQENLNCEDSFLCDQLNSKIDELTSRISTLTRQNEELQRSLDKAEREIISSKVSKESENNELQSLKIVHNQTLQEIEAIREALHSRDAKIDAKEEKKRRREEKKQQALIVQLEDTNKCLEKKIFEIQLEKERLIQSEKEAKNETEKAANEKKTLLEQISKLQYDLADARQRASQAVPLTEEDIIPPSAWQMTDADSSLSQRIAKIASNNALHAVSKLQQCFKAIASYYTKQIDQMRHTAEESSAQSQKMLTLLSDFVISLSIALNDKAVNIDEFIQYPDISASLISRVNGLRAQITELTRAKEILQSIIDGVAATFGITDSTDISNKLNNVRGQVDEKLAAMDRRIKKLKEMNTDLNDQITLLKAENEKLSSDFSRAKSTLETMNKQCEELSVANRKLKSENAASKRALSDLEERAENAAKQFRANDEESKRAAVQAVNSIKNELGLTIEHLTAELQKANSTIAEADAKIQKQCRTIHAQKASLAEKERDLAALKQQAEISARRSSEVSAIEKRQAQESHERAIREITSQCDKFRQDVAALSQQSTKREKQLKESKNEIAQLRREISRLEKELACKEEEAEREAKIAESALRGAQMTAESQFTARLSEHRMKWEAEKRRILAFAADELRQFFNASEAIDEHSFRSLICKAKEEISRLQRSDSAIRRMVGASGRQTTDDAVAQLVLTSN